MCWFAQTTMSVVSYINHQGGVSSKRLFILAERLLEWAQLNLRSLRAAHLPGRLNQGADMLSRSNVPSEEWMLIRRWFRRSGRPLARQKWPFRLQRQLSLPQLIIRRTGMRGPRLAQPPPLCIPPIALLPQVVRAYQGTGSQGAIGGPLVEEPTWLSELTQLLTAAPWPVPLRRESPLSGERNNIWHPRPELLVLSTFGRSMGAYWLPRASVKHHFWG